MKIITVSSAFSKEEGGATGIAYDQARELKNKGYDVFVFTTIFNNQNLGWGEENGIKIYRIKSKNLRYIFRSYFCLFNFSVQYKFKKFLQEVKPDVIHFHNLYYQLPFSLIKIASQFSKKVFFTTHDVNTFSTLKLNHFIDKRYNLENINEVNYYLPIKNQIKQDKKAFNPFRNLVIRYYLKYLTKIFSVSQELKKALLQNKIRNIEVIHNGINIDQWQADQFEVEELKNNLGLRNKKIILFVGRLSGNKGGEVITKAMNQIVKVIPDAVLLVLGEKNSYAQKMINSVEKNNLEKQIIFKGQVDRNKMKNYYSISDLVVVPSVCFDSFPTVNLEAMAGKKPVITTIFGGSREIIEDKKTGFIINPLNIENLAEKIIYLLQNPEQAERIGKSGYEKVKSDFSLDEHINRLLDFFLTNNNAPADSAS